MCTVANVKKDLDIFHGPKNDSKYLDAEVKVFNKDDNKEFRMVQNLAMGEADFNQFLQLRNQPVIAAREKTFR